MDINDYRNIVDFSADHIISIIPDSKISSCVVSTINKSRYNFHKIHKIPNEDEPIILYASSKFRSITFQMEYKKQNNYKFQSLKLLAIKKPKDNFISYTDHIHLFVDWLVEWQRNLASTILIEWIFNNKNYEDIENELVEYC